MLDKNNVINPNDVLANLDNDGRKFLLEEFLPNIEQVEGETSEEPMEIYNYGYDEQTLKFYIVHLLSEIHQLVASDHAYRIRVIKLSGHVMGVDHDDIFDISNKLSLVCEIINEEDTSFEENLKQKMNVHILEFFNNLFCYRGCSMPCVDYILSEILDEIFDEHKETLKLVYDYAGALGGKETRCGLSEYLRESLTN